MVKQKTSIKKVLDIVAIILLIVGGLNWGLVGFFNFNLVQLLGNLTFYGLTYILYGLVGLSAIYSVYKLAKGIK